MHTKETPTPECPFIQTPQFKAVWDISSSIRHNLEPSMHKVAFMKEMLVYADMEEVFIQKNADDVLSGIIEILDDVLTGFHAVTDNISNTYNKMEVVNG